MQPGRNKSLSYIRAVACFGIVCLHSFLVVGVKFSAEISTGTLYILRGLTNSFLWCVPIFMMVTGSLLLKREKEITMDRVVHKYVKRVVLALLIFTFIYRIFDLCFGDEEFTLLRLIECFKIFFIGTGWVHLWYLYTLIGLYFLIPFLKKITDNSNGKEILTFISIGVIFVSVLPLARLWGWNTAFFIHISNMYPFYLLIGFAVERKMLKIKKSLAGMVVVLMLVALWVSTYFVVSKGRQDYEFLTGYASIFTVALSTGIFSLSLSVRDFNGNLLDKLLLSVDENSFGIYLIHMIFVRGLYKYIEFNPLKYSWLALGLCIVVVFVLSYFTTLILRHSKLVKRII